MVFKNCEGGTKPSKIHGNYSFTGDRAQGYSQCLLIFAKVYFLLDSDLEGKRYTSYKPTRKL